MWRLPDLQQPLPLQRHHLERGEEGRRDRRRSVQGLRHLRRRLPGWSDPGQGFTDEQIYAEIDGILAAP